MPNNQKGFISFFIFIILVGLAAAIYFFALAPYRMSGDSMLPKLFDRQFLLVEKWDKDFKRGDIVVFRNPQNPDQDLIKRIIALPGDKIQIGNRKVFVNGELLTEGYLKELSLGTELKKYPDENTELALPKNSYFVMGDNRPKSIDSRDFGPVNKDNIVGRLWVTYAI